MKCGGTFSKGRLAVCPAKVTNCTSYKYKGHFTRLSKSRPRHVNIVKNRIVDNTDFNQSDLPDVNTDHVNRECYGVMVGIWTK